MPVEPRPVPLAFTPYLCPGCRCSRHVYRPRAHDRAMVDFLSVLGIVIFAAVMLGLIWCLERV
jgi:hypothetical protein